MKSETEIKKEIRSMQRKMREAETRISKAPIGSSTRRIERDLYFSYQAQIDILKWVIKPVKKQPTNI